MNGGHIFAHAVVRRVAYVLVALVLGWLGVGGEARAQSVYQCDAFGNGWQQCTREQAYWECKLWIGDQMGAPIYGGVVNKVEQDCTYADLGSSYGYRATVCRARDGGLGDCYSPLRHGSFAYGTECPAGYYWDDVNKTCGTPCSDKPSIPGSEKHALGSESSFCYEGCLYTGRGQCLGIVIDGIESTYCSYWTTELGATCSVGESPEPIVPPVDSDGDGISDENDLSPNNPGVGNADGQEPSRACGGPGQPECLPDGSNEGSGRGNTSTGGGDCNTPPRSSGDAILAQIAFQTWATRCAVLTAANVKPGSGSGGGDGDGDGEASEMDRLRNEAAGLDTSLGEGDADAAWIEAPSSLDLDTGGLGIGGTCPAPPTINGVSIDPDNNLCMLVQIIGSLVLVGAFAHAGYIIGRA
jgi:hypothetical protein